MLPQFNNSEQFYPLNKVNLMIFCGLKIIYSLYYSTPYYIWEYNCCYTCVVGEVGIVADGFSYRPATDTPDDVEAAERGLIFEVSLRLF